MRLFSAATLMLLSWGALAFGAEYSWAYSPLLVLAVSAGALGARASRGAAFPSRALLASLGIAALAVVLQLLLPPLPRWHTDEASLAPVDYQRLRASVLLQPDPIDAAAPRIAIAPEQSLLGLAFLASLVTLLTGVTRAISTRGPRLLLPGIVALGLVVALIGIAQASLRSEHLYGFWLPTKSGVPFAPFINENHFAGWMVMALSLAAGWFTGGVVRAVGGMPAGWRQRALWFSSPAASETVLTGFAIAVMSLSVVVTFSRGGLIGLGAAAAISIWWVTRRQSSRARRVAAAAILTLVFLFAALWGDVGQTLVQFDTNDLSWGGRKQVWLDTIRIIRDYPWAGTGLNTYGVAMLHYQTTPRGEYFIEAHNDYLQLAAEGGLLLCIPVLITIGLFIREVVRRFREGADDERTYWLRAGAVTGLISIAVMEIFDFTLQMPGAAVLFVVLAAIAIHRPDYLARRREARAHRE